MVSKFLCDFRWFLLLAAAVALIHIQMCLFTTQLEHADQLAAAGSLHPITSSWYLLLDRWPFEPLALFQEIHIQLLRYVLGKFVIIMCSQHLDF
ncbi:hypothetical protein EUGRSUZ_H02481 [Eucalyptus grandis]|uniref:Uncharacterized protein n=1 Tax=Eucalyptus grandis TaxID=71139 RepID=A0ACC3JSP3_EUCGR|nr:hypothetical protein EUGRSUZ_H02481 [Eucalyptus grandis]